MEKQPQGQGSGERRTWGGCGVGYTKKRRKDWQMERSRREGRLGWAPGSGGPAWALECGRWLCSLHLWVSGSGRVGQRESAPPGNLSACQPPILPSWDVHWNIISHSGPVLFMYHQNAQECLHLPQPAGSSQPMPPTQEATFSLNSFRPSQNHRRLVGNMPLPTPHLPLLSSLFFLLPFPFFLPLTSPSPPGMEWITSLAYPGGGVGRAQHTDPLPLCKASGPLPPKSGRASQGLLLTPFPARMRSSLATPTLALRLTKRYTVDPRAKPV